jgi:hypothetical protein
MLSLKPLKISEASGSHPSEIKCSRFKESEGQVTEANQLGRVFPHFFCAFPNLLESAGIRITLFQTTEAYSSLDRIKATYSICKAILGRKGVMKRMNASRFSA